MLFHFWFHTAFVKDMQLKVMKHELDKAVKDIARGHKLYPPGFSVSLSFTSAQESDVEASLFRYKKKQLSKGSIPKVFRTSERCPGSKTSEDAS